MRDFRNIYACLVHEQPDCILDLVENLYYLDPESIILLYNGGNDRDLLHTCAFERFGVVIHPDPKPMQWGELHQFALDCMSFALAEFEFDSLTIVDSDQLAIQPGYSSLLEKYFSEHTNVGLLSSNNLHQNCRTKIAPVKQAFKELSLWRPFLLGFPGGESKFVYWSFWPGTVFSKSAAKDLIDMFENNSQLQTIMQHSRIWATEEVVLPTLTALLGYDINENPFLGELVQFRTQYTQEQVVNALTKLTSFWVHPVLRKIGDPLRSTIRQYYFNYQTVKQHSNDVTEDSSFLLLSLPIINTMQGVEGWFEDIEADLLIAVASLAIKQHGDEGCFVEIGAYCGRTTVVLGQVIKRLNAQTKFYSIDPHDGLLGARDAELINRPGSYETLMTNLAALELKDSVTVIRKYAFQVAWNDTESVAFLLIDHLHDYASVSQDFIHFESYLIMGGYIAFHDHASYFPGVILLVKNLIDSGSFVKCEQAGSLIVLQKIAEFDSTIISSKAENLNMPVIESRSSVIEPVIPAGFEAFRNFHQGETIVVCGCGVSLKDFSHSEDVITIGVNDVGRLFDPDYLVVLNSKKQFSGDRFNYVAESRAKAVFTQLNLGITHPNIVRFELGKRGGVDFCSTNKLAYSRNSPYVAIMLALYMGAKRIGLVGVDFNNDHFFAKTGEHSLTRSLAQINKEYALLSDACMQHQVEFVNLSQQSLLNALPVMEAEQFLFQQTKSAEKKDKPLKIVSYATSPVAGVPAILARCINHATQHSAQCVWATNHYGNGVSFEGGVEWTSQTQKCERLLQEADVIIIHNGKVEAKHKHLLEGKALVVMAHNYAWNVDHSYILQGFPGIVVGQYQATLKEFENWSVVPNPMPIWENVYQSDNKAEVITISYTPFGKHDIYPKEHKLYWHSKGYATTMDILQNLAKSYPIRLEVIRSQQVSHQASLTMKKQAHIVIDECVTGSYHRNSLEGLAMGCVVVNGMGLLKGVEEAFCFCAGDTEEVPFVYSGLQNLQQVLTDLIKLGVDDLGKKGERNRVWMQQYWGFDQQWKTFWIPVVEQALINARASKNLKEERQEYVIDGKSNFVSIIIPHGGADRIANLTKTLTKLQQCKGEFEIVVVEMSVNPTLNDKLHALIDQYIYIKSNGVFERSRVLNTGLPFIKADLVLWLDNDLLLPDDFLIQAVNELYARNLDYLVPYTSVRYLSEIDSNDIRAGVKQAQTCTWVQELRVGKQATGGAGLARKQFLIEYGGLDEKFRGWGGEDNAWVHKVSVLGRWQVTQKKEQFIYHLFHPGSGGHVGHSAMRENPFYQDNLKLLFSMRRIKRRDLFLQKFPPPEHATCPWDNSKRIVFIIDNKLSMLGKAAKALAQILDQLYLIKIEYCTSNLINERLEDLDAIVFFGSKKSLNLFVSMDLKIGSVKHLLVTDCSYKLDRQHMPKSAQVARICGPKEHGISLSKTVEKNCWTFSIQENFFGLALLQPLSLVLGTESN